MVIIRLIISFGCVLSSSNIDDRWAKNQQLIQKKCCKSKAEWKFEGFSCSIVSTNETGRKTIHVNFQRIYECKIPTLFQFISGVTIKWNCLVISAFIIFFLTRNISMKEKDLSGVVLHYDPVTIIIPARSSSVNSGIENTEKSWQHRWKHWNVGLRACQHKKLGNQR